MTIEKIFQIRIKQKSAFIKKMLKSCFLTFEWAKIDDIMLSISRKKVDFYKIGYNLNLFTI